MAWIYNLDGSVEAIHSSQAIALEDTISQGVLQEVTDSELETMQRAWRNQKLKDTDWIVPVTDHPERSDYLTYRTNLRDWPSTDGFPNTRPTL